MPPLTPFTEEEKEFFDNIGSKYYCQISPWHKSTSGMKTIMIDMQAIIDGRKMGLQRIAENYFYDRDKFPLSHISIEEFYENICEDMMETMKTFAGR